MKNQRQTPLTRLAKHTLILTALLIATTPALAEAQITREISYEQLLAASIERQQHNPKLDEVQEAINTIGAGGTSIYASEVTAHLKRNFQTIPTSTIIKVPSKVKDNLITKGEDFERLNRIAQPILRYLWLEGKVHPLLFKSEVPDTWLSWPNAVLVTTRTMALLNDSELEARIAHEVCHLLGHELIATAIDQHNDRALRAIELFCDAGAAAIITSKNSKADPTKIITGLMKTAQVLEVEFGQTLTKSEHPTVDQRRRLNKELQKQFAQIAQNR